MMYVLNTIMEIHPLILYKNYGMRQSLQAIAVFENLLSRTKPARIIEIGTDQGGLIVALKDIIDTLNLDTTLRSYDIKDYKKIYPEIRSMGIDQRVENIFDSEYRNLTPDKKEELVSLIQSDGISIILCDGGNKINEFNCLSQYLKTNDIIMAHDYAETLKDFAENIKYKLWNWCEIKGSDIKNACDMYNLTDFMKDEFRLVAWTCKQKQ